MWAWILQTTLFSVVLIALVHHLFHFFKTTLTIPKVKDLVNRPAQKYQHMYDIIHPSQERAPIEEYSLIDLLPSDLANAPLGLNANERLNAIPSSGIDMKSELKHFLKSQLGSG
jgi:hypothetical protein